MKLTVAQPAPQRRGNLRLPDKQVIFLKNVQLLLFTLTIGDIFHLYVIWRPVFPLSGQSMFHDYLARYPAGGTQHIAFRLPVSNFDRGINDLSKQGYAIISKVV